MTREDIVNTAFKVWGRDLYRTMSLSEIARELGVSKTALYRHFKDKEALLDAMYTAFFDGCAAFIRESYERSVSADPHTGSLIMMRTFAEYNIRNRDAFIFSLIQVYDRQRKENTGSEFRKRGIDLRRLVYDETGGVPR
ncbi:MAG: TetR/AcrR family transcriptional regulator, partial [Treponema sp.]|nr:TetR/AcrR family transcriptional regulator [Treponema sp.]